MASKIMSTGLVPDSELEDTDIYGNVPLVSYEDDDEDESEEDTSLGAGGKGDDEDEEAPPMIEPSAREVLVKPGNLRNDDPAAYGAFTSRDGGGVSPGEAQRLIDYMRPLSVEEEELSEDPMFNDLTFADDAAAMDDLLRHAKGSSKAMTNFMQDEIYGGEASSEELADRRDTDRVAPRALVRTSPRRPVLTQARAKRLVMSGLGRTLVDEHAAWLEEQDRKAGITLRPHGYYLNVSKLWAADKLKRAALPVSMKGDFSGSLGAFVGAAEELIHLTTDKRIAATSMGWGWSSIKNIGKKAVHLAKRSVTDPLKYGYKYTKKGIQLTKKGIEAGLSLAQRAALAPIKAVISKFRGKMVNQRAAYYAKQAGVKVPTPAMQSQALAWSKDFVRKNDSRYGGTIASLMGHDDGPGLYAVDISLGDDMGSSFGDIAKLIVLGPFMIANALENLIKKAFGWGGGGQPAAGDQPDDPSMQDQGSPDDGSADPGAGDPGAGDPGAGDPGAGDPGDQPDDGSQGYAALSRHKRNSQIRRTVTLEQMTHMSAQKRAKVQQALRMGRIRLV